MGCAMSSSKSDNTKNGVSPNHKTQEQLDWDQRKKHDSGYQFLEAAAKSDNDQGLKKE